MVLDVVDIISKNPQVLLFILLAIGYLLGRIPVGPFRLGSAPGILIAALVAGALGFSLFPGTGDVGFLFFLYAVAFQAGPAFFTIVLADGAKYISLAAVVTIVGFLLSYLFKWVFSFPPGIATGLLGGSLTSPPGLAAAIDAIRTGSVVPPTGITAEAFANNIQVSYAITFIFGMIGVTLFFRAMPRWLGFDLVAESVRAAEEKHVVHDKHNDLWTMTLRAYEIANPAVVGKTVKELQQISECSVQVYKQMGNLVKCHDQLPLALGDRLSIWGTADRQDQLDQLLGPEVLDSDLLDVDITSYEVTVTKSDAVGKTVQDLGISNQSGFHLTAASRSGINLNLSPRLRLEQGDVVTISGMRSRLDKLVNQIGYVERNVNETDLVTFAAGVVAGFFLGQINIKLGGLAIGLSTAGGLLFVGILLGYLRSIHPTFGRVPPATLWIFKELGLLLFLADIGVKAGRGIIPAFQTSVGVVVFLCGLVVSTLPIVIGYLFGTSVLKLNRALLLGALTGSVTCTPAMAAVNTDSRSSIPAIGYAGTYAFGHIFCTLACSIMTRLL